MRGLAVLTLALTALGLGTSSPAGAKSSRQPSQAVVAKHLVSRLRAAHTLRSRQAALLTMMRALHLAVITPRGKVLVRGGPDARYLYLYTPELTAIAGGLARGETLSAGALAAKLGAAGIRPGGKPLSAAAFRVGLAQAIRRVAGRPRSRSSLSGLIIRQLGLSAKQKVNLAAPPAASKLALDPLQTVLLLADVADVSAKARAGQPRRRARASDRAAARASDLASGCQAIDDTHKQSKQVESYLLAGGEDGVAGFAMKYWLGGKLGDLLKSHYPKYGALKKILGPVEKALDLLHGGALAFSVKVQGSPELVSPPAHYPHGTSAPDQRMALHIKVEMLDNYGEDVIACGPLVGMKFPKQGGIPNVPMLWQYPELAKHGTIECPADGCKKTGQDGVATLTLNLKHEEIPGIGLEQYQTGNAEAIAQYQSAFGAGFTDASGIAQYLIPKYGGVRWQVTWHAEPSLTLSVDSGLSANFTSPSECCGSASYHVVGSAAVQQDEVSRTFIGTGPLNFMNYSWSQLGQPSVCVHPGDQTMDTTSTGSVNGRMLVRALKVAPNGADPGVTLDLDISQTPKEKLHRVIHASASGCSESSYDFTDQQWSNSFRQLQNFAGRPTATGMEITGWHRGTGNVYAYKDVTYSSPIFGESGTAHQRLELLTSPD